LLTAFLRNTIILCPTRPPRIVVNMPTVSLPRQYPGTPKPAGESSSLRGASALVLVLLVPVLADAGEPSPEQFEFFEKKIRPVLLQHCYKCHSSGAKKVRGGLLLDSRDGIRKGGDSGPAIVPGDPATSRLFKALRCDELQMPPDGKLSDQVIADFETWIK